MYILYTKKSAFLLLVFLGVMVVMTSVIAFASTYAIKQLQTSTSAGDDKTVIIDPGHGEPDGGAVGVDGVIEKDINLSISLKIKSLLDVFGYTVILTRKDDNAIYDEGSKTIRKKKVTDLHNRLEIVNSRPNAVFISIHQNIYKSSKSSGSIVFYSPNNEKSKQLAETVQTGITTMLQPQNTRLVNQAKKNLYILYYAKSPAIMVECGFLSNPDECKLLQDDTYQSKMAFAISCAVMKFYASK